MNVLQQIIASIRGGSRSIPNGSYGLDSSGSIIPSGTASYSWSCSPSCDNLISDTTANSTSIYFSNLGTYVITLTITSSSGAVLQDTETVTLTVVSNPVPPFQVVISTPSTLITSVSGLTLTASVIGPAANYTYQWSSMGNSKPVTDLNTQLTTNLLVVNPGALLSGITYTFTVQVQDSSYNINSASIVVQTRLTPCGGLFTVQPISGTYVLTLRNWNPSSCEGNSPLFYQFLIQNSTYQLPLTEVTTSNRLVLTNLPNGTWSFVGRVYDSTGSLTESFVSLTVSSSSVTNDAPIQLASQGYCISADDLTSYTAALFQGNITNRLTGIKTLNQSLAYSPITPYYLLRYMGLLKFGLSSGPVGDFDYDSIYSTLRVLSYGASGLLKISNLFQYSNLLTYSLQVIGVTTKLLNDSTTNVYFARNLTFIIRNFSQAIVSNQDPREFPFSYSDYNYNISFTSHKQTTQNFGQQFSTQVFADSPFSISFPSFFLKKKVFFKLFFLF